MRCAIQKGRGKVATIFSFFPIFALAHQRSYLQDTPSYHERNKLSLIAEGDEGAFYEFYTHHAGKLRPFLFHYTQSQMDVEDIIQETFIRVWLHRDQLPAIGNMDAWIFRIASRVYLNHLEREVKRRERKEPFGEVLYGTGQSLSAERTHLQEITHHLQEALSTLSAQKRKVFRLNRELDMKPAQIAAHLQLPVGTVKNQLSAALREIREYLSASGYGPLAIIYVMTLPGLFTS